MEEAVVSLMLGGDVMLGRFVGEQIGSLGYAYPLGGIAALMRRADLTIVNLECAITSSTQHWSGPPKAFYFGAPPQAVQSLLDAGISGVSLANNHVLDFGVAGLRDTLHTLRRCGIGCAGAGMDSDEAHAPLFFERNGIKFGMVAFCDHQGDFAAGGHTPGIAYLDLADEESALAQFRASLMQLEKGRADWPMLSLHWGPNMVDRPSARFVRLAHTAIDMGYRILFGHSAHVFHGVELYRGCPVIYAAGDVVDDYRVEPEFGNDHQLLFELELSRDALRSINLHPVFIEDSRVQPAAGRQFAYIARRAGRLCAELGTRVDLADGKLWIDCRKQEL
jgi:poly-gamma-glutamate capsule biosynthesis protein CapA/YwtB (metallophosphatase superfamily)